jgi:hypothetical protein
MLVVEQKLLLQVCTTPAFADMGPGSRPGRRGEILALPDLIVIASAAKQSTLSLRCSMDCFVAEPVIGRALARPVGSQEETGAWQDARYNKTVVARLDRAIQYAAASRFITAASGILDRPHSRTMTVK